MRPTLMTVSMARLPLLGQRWMQSAALATLLLAPVAGVGLMPKPAIAQAARSQVQPAERVLTVVGRGLIEIPTTLAQVNLGVVVQAKTAAEAQAQAAQQSTAVVDWVRSQNVDKLQTTGISLSPRYDYSGDRQVITGYQASNTISFQLETDRAGAVMDEAVSVGATQINGVSFLAEEAAIAAARQQALQAAIEDGQTQADTVLTALGFSRQEIVNVFIGSVSAPPVASGRLLAAENAISTPVVGQNQTITAQVTLHIRY